MSDTPLYAGARFNIAQAVFDGKDPDALAVVHASERAPEELRCWTVKRLHRLTCQVAWALRAQGYQPSDAIGLVRHPKIRMRGQRTSLGNFVPGSIVLVDVRERLCTLVCAE